MEVSRYISSSFPTPLKVTPEMLQPLNKLKLAGVPVSVVLLLGALWCIKGRQSAHQVSLSVNSIAAAISKIGSIGKVEFPKRKLNSSHKAVVLVETETVPSFLMALRSHDVDKYVSNEILQQGTMHANPELMTSIQTAARAQPGSTFVDVGANLGFFGLYARALGMKVAFIDIQCGNTERIKLSAQLNGWVDGVDVHRNAASAEAGSTMRIVQGDPENPGGFGLEPAGTSSLEQCAVATSITIDGLLPIEHVAVMKIDVESHERFVLTGMDKMLREKRVQKLHLEYWGVTGSGWILKLLEYGYSIKIDVRSFDRIMSLKEHKYSGSRDLTHASPSSVAQLVDDIRIIEYVDLEVEPRLKHS